MKTVLMSLVCVLLVSSVGWADNIRGGISMDFVNIGHAGNAADMQVMIDGTTGYGGVSYNYRIGKYDVTNAQWNAFTAAAGAPTGSDGGYSFSSSWPGAQQPITNVSWYETAQFCNWLTSGDKSKGSYQFSGNNANPGAFLGVNRGAAISAYGTVYVIPTEDEWYKAAYYKPDGSGYALYANGTNTAPVAGVQSNYNCSLAQPWNVGSGSQEQNGTFDMMGNVLQWNETQLYGSNRGQRGGSFLFYDNLASSYRNFDNPLDELPNLGFRVVSVPEPATLLLLGLGGMIIRKFKSKSAKCKSVESDGRVRMCEKFEKWTTWT